MGKVVFFLTTGRTGTKKLAAYFKEFCPPQVAVDHQTPGARTINILANMRYHGFSVDALINRKVQCILKKRENMNCYINCDPLLSFGLSYVDFTGVDVRFVHIIREAEDFARSMINWQFTKTKSWIAHNLIPFWQPDVWPFEHAVHLFRGEYLRNKYFRIWKTKNTIFAEEFRDKYPYLKIDFEKLFDYKKGEQTFARLADFMGFEIAFHSGVFFKKENDSAPRFWH